MNNMPSKWVAVGSVAAAVITGIFLLVNTFLQNTGVIPAGSVMQNLDGASTVAAPVTPEIATLDRLESSEMEATGAAIAQPTIDAINANATIKAQVILTTSAAEAESLLKLDTLATAKAIEGAADAAVIANKTLQAASVNATKTIASLPTLVPTETALPTAVETATEASTSGLTIGSTRVREQDGMVQVFVPAGSFTMGSNSGVDDEKPAHSVQLSAYWIDQTEVANAMYDKCVAVDSCSRIGYRERTKFNGSTQPVVGIDWNGAKNYCEWVGGQLPTEAQWEYAARGPENYIYPWGAAEPTEMLANFDNNVLHPSSVGSYAAGASWVGALDMSGNVWEWVDDWYGVYPIMTEVDPSGPTGGEYRILRGGSWNDVSNALRTAYRFIPINHLRDLDALGSSRSNIGFRCAAPLQ